MFIISPEGIAFEESALRVEVSKACCSVYAVESMLYLTAGLMDLYKNTDIDVETAVLKVSWNSYSSFNYVKIKRF